MVNNEDKEVDDTEVEVRYSIPLNLKKRLDIYAAKEQIRKKVALERALRSFLDDRVKEI